MKKFFVAFAVLLIVTFLAVVLWMNATPGYFHKYGCCQSDQECDVRYTQKADCSGILVCNEMYRICPSSFKNLLLLKLARLDFNK